MIVKVHDISGKDTGRTVELSEKIFNVKPHDHSIWLDIRSIRANQRQGTHSSKGRSEVSGGGRKPFRQKGTGRARQGTIRAPHHVGGGVVFGPKPRTYHVGINKKVKQLARKSALSYKSKEKNITVIENFSFDAPKTKKLMQFIKAMEMENLNILILTGKNEVNVSVSAKNCHKIEVRDSAAFSTYDVLRAQKIIFQEGALEKVNEVLGQ